MAIPPPRASYWRGVSLPTAVRVVFGELVFVQDGVVVRCGWVFPVVAPGFCGHLGRRRRWDICADLGAFRLAAEA